MHVKKSVNYTHILFINILFLTFVTSCDKKGNNYSKFTTHTEKKDNLEIEFDTPVNYTKDLWKQRARLSFFDEKDIIIDGDIVYFSPDEYRSYVSLSIWQFDTLDEYAIENNIDFSDSAWVKFWVLNNMRCNNRTPLLYEGMDGNGNRFYYVMYFTRYSDDYDGSGIPDIGCARLPADSVETYCGYYSKINNTNVLLQYYMLQPLDKFSFMDMVSMLQSVKVSY